MKHRIGLVILAVFVLAACDSEQELSDPKTYPYESLPAFLSAEDFSEIQLEDIAVLPCPDGITAIVTFDAPNQAFGLRVSYDEGLRATVQTASEADIDTVVAIFGPDDGNGYFGALPIALDDDGGPDGQLSDLLETIDEAGDYFVVVTTAGGTGRGDVTLVIGADNCEQDPVCETDAECAVGELCMNGLCVTDTDPCNDITCPVGFVCVDGACTPEANGCQADSDCEDNNPCTRGFCDAATAQCRYTGIPGCGELSCASNADCDEWEICSDGVCMPDPNQCVDASDCASGESCVNGSCVADTDPCALIRCSEGHICVDGQCIDDPTRCFTDSDCEDGNVCTQSVCMDGLCAYVPFTDGTACDDGDACSAFDVCAAGVCLGAPLACADGEMCVDGECVPFGAPCSDDTDCDDGDPCTTDICDATTLQCVHVAIPDPICLTCTSDADCAPGDICVAGMCQLAPDPCDGIVCDEGQYCVDGVCVAGQMACDTNSDCPLGQVCMAGVCQAAGVECSADADCDDGDPCTMDYCDATTATCAAVTDPACD